MEMHTTTRALRGRRAGGARARLLTSIITACVCALALASSASAATTVTVGIAPISNASGSFVLTLTNTGAEPVTGFFVAVGETTNADPATCVPNTPVVGALNCQTAVAPGGSFQVCYTGSGGSGGELTELVPGTNIFVNNQHGLITGQKLPAVSSCPVAGFKGASTTGPPTSGSSAKCVVPKLKGKTLAAAEKALAKAHCKTGAIKRVKSKHAKKGTVIAQGTPAGKSLAAGSKVKLTASK